MRKWLIAALLVAALVAVVINFAELEKFGDLLSQARPLWLFVALLLQLSTYAFVAAGWAATLRAAGAASPMRKLVPLSIAKLFADQAVPTAGMSGNVFLVD